MPRPTLPRSAMHRRVRRGCSDVIVFRIGFAAALLLGMTAHAQPAAPAGQPKLGISGAIQPGGLLFVTAPPETKRLSVDGQPVPPAPDGRYLVGLPRDTAGPVVLEAERSAGPSVRAELAVPKRTYRIQRLPALGTTDTPTKEWLDRRGREVALITAAKQAAGSDQKSAAGYAQPFSRPAEGRISGVYGSQRVFGGLERPPHWGLDIANATGTPVRAPADGVVRLAGGPYLLEGNMVVLDHGAGLVTLYVHLDSLGVKSGDKVRKGDRLGTIGTTGRSTGPHLHWGLSLMRPAARVGEPLKEVRLDPALLLR